MGVGMTVETAEYPPLLASILDTWGRIHDHLTERWADPVGYENPPEDIEARWADDHLILVLDLAISFGIAYEHAYPTGRRDEWPVPLAERPEDGDSE